MSIFKPKMPWDIHASHRQADVVNDYVRGFRKPLTKEEKHLRWLDRQEEKERRRRFSAWSETEKLWLVASILTVGFIFLILR